MPCSVLRDARERHRPRAGEHRGIEVGEAAVRVDVRARKDRPRSASRRVAARCDTAARHAYPRPGARPRAAARGRSRRDSARRECGESRTSGSARRWSGAWRRNRRAFIARSCVASFRWQADKPPRRDFPQRRRRRPAFRHRVRAPRMEMAARRRRERRRNFALDRHERALARLDLAHFREQRLRVRMVRRGEELRRRSRLDDAPEIHDDDAIADVLDDAEIVADEKIGEVAAPTSSP